jgi:hypothetical protein
MTSFDYDAFGRRVVSEQEFTDAGVKYHVTYSGHAFDDFGRLAAYSAEIKRVE